MIINRIKIKNFKSIKELDIEPNAKVNSFIGENSVGKSNIIDAIKMVIGLQSYNGKELPKEIHYECNYDNKIYILIAFADKPEIELIEDSNSNKANIFINASHAGEVRREEYISAFLGVEREINNFLPTNQYTLLGRLFKTISEYMKKEEIEDEETGERITKEKYIQKELAKINQKTLMDVKDESGNNIMGIFSKILKEESAKQLNREQNEIILDTNYLNIGNPYKNLEIKVLQELGIEMNIKDMGMGAQASMAIAILRAYSKLKLKEGVPLFIDEPEIFLHPIAQRRFYNILRDLAENGMQIFITTHSPDFISVENFEEVFIVKKNKEKGTYCNNAIVSNFVVDLKQRLNIDTDEQSLKLQYKNAYENTGDTQKANEAFFSKKILLVEGESETFILPYLFSLIGYDMLDDGLTIVRCGGKSELDRFYRLYSEFKIPTYIIFDGDKQHEGTQSERETIKKNRNLLKLFGIEMDYPDQIFYENIFGFTERIEENLNIGEISKKGLELFKVVKERITTEEQIPQWTKDLVEKLKALKDTESILLK